MIPRAHVTAWRASAPWPTDAQIEQDLVLSRALVEMRNQPISLTLPCVWLKRGGEDGWSVSCLLTSEALRL